MSVIKHKIKFLTSKMILIYFHLSFGEFMNKKNKKSESKTGRNSKKPKSRAKF